MESPEETIPVAGITMGLFNSFSVDSKPIDGAVPRSSLARDSGKKADIKEDYLHGDVSY